MVKIANSVSSYPVRDAGCDEAVSVMSAVLVTHFANGTTLLYGNDGQFWSFSGTHWSPLPKKALEGLLLAAVQANPTLTQRTATLVSQGMALLSAKVASRDDLLRFDLSPLPVVNCKNGELWVAPDGGVSLQPHQPTSYLRHCLEVEYRPEQPCPLYDRAIAKIFGKSSDPAALVDFWHELVGYAIQPDRRVPLVLIGKGSGSNGKTALCDILVRTIGMAQRAAMPIHTYSRAFWNPKLIHSARITL